MLSRDADTHFYSFVCGGLKHKMLRVALLEKGGELSGSSACFVSVLQAERKIPHHLTGVLLAERERAFLLHKAPKLVEPFGAEGRILFNLREYMQRLSYT